MPDDTPAGSADQKDAGNPFLLDSAAPPDSLNGWQTDGFAFAPASGPGADRFQGPAPAFEAPLPDPAAALQNPGTAGAGLAAGGSQVASDGSGVAASGAGTSSVAATGTASIDGLLMGAKWNTATLTYSFPTTTGSYAAPNPSGGAEETHGFQSLTAQEQAVMRAVLEGTAATGVITYGSYESFTNLNFTEVAGADSLVGAADIRMAVSSDPDPTAYAYYPTSASYGGDIWFGTSSEFNSPAPGSWGYLTGIHEMGHALGLKHPHDTDFASSGFGALPVDQDSLEFTVMSYRSYIGASTSTGYTNETFGYPTTPMMLDIQALQTLYGADYTLNATNTTYSWSSTTGEMSVNGVGQGAPGGNRIFLTIWDGGGRDSYDMSNYTNGVSVDLRPGKWSVNAQDQLAILQQAVFGGEIRSRGTVFNALLFNGDTASLIEDAVGGAGNDTFTGNQASNSLVGGGGNDWVSFVDADRILLNLGSAGDAVVASNQGTDTLSGFENVIGTAGNDSIAGSMAVGEYFDGGAGDDTLITSGTGNDTLVAGTGSDYLDGGAGTDWAIFAVTNGVTLSLDGAGNGGATASDGNDTLFGIENIRTGSGNDIIGSAVAGGSYLDAGAGNDSIATGSGNDTLVGDLGSDTLVGGAGTDSLLGGDSADLLYGSDSAGSGSDADYLDGGIGDDSILAADGNDTILAGDGNDSIVAGGGDDTITGGLGNDTLIGGAGTDWAVFTATGAVTVNLAGGNGTATGGDGSDTLSGIENIRGGNGADRIITNNSFGAYLDGGLGADTIVANGTGNDTLVGGAQNDSLVAGAGDDLLDGGAGSNVMDGGTGTDWVTYGTVSNIVGITVSLDSIGGGNATGGANDTLRGIENLHGSSLDDQFTGSSPANIFEGGTGNDTLAGGAGTDTLVGGLGDDRIQGSDSLGTGTDGDSLDGGAGNDTILGAGGNDTIAGGDDNDSIQAGAGDNRIDGGAGNDTILAGTGNDSIFTGDGNNYVDAGDGSNTVIGGTGNDTVLTGVGNDYILTDANDSIVSGAGDDTIDTGIDNDTIDAGAGNDSINAGDGEDVVQAGADNDTIYAGTGNDSIDAGTGDDWVDAGAGNDTVLGGAGNDTIDGGAGDDLIIWHSGDGSDTILGGLGTDTLQLDGWDGAFGTGTDSIANGTYGSWVVSGSAADRILVNGSTTIHAAGFDGIACFAAGTRIATARGEVPVEALRLGDLVVTAGRGAGLRPIRWLGRTRADIARHPDRTAIAPILVRAGALGSGAPHRDLRVSPDHALHLDGHLVPAALLVNGTTILQELWCPAVEYWHVELDSHGLLIAEGALAESYLDDGNRGQFDNGPITTLFKDFACNRASGTYDRMACLPVLRAGETLAAIRERLAPPKARRAGAPDQAPPRPGLRDFA